HVAGTDGRSGDPECPARQERRWGRVLEDFPRRVLVDAGLASQVRGATVRRSAGDGRPGAVRAPLGAGRSGRGAGIAVDGRVRPVPAVARGGAAGAGGNDRGYVGAALRQTWCLAHLRADVAGHHPVLPRHTGVEVTADLRTRVRFFPLPETFCAGLPGATFRL